MTLSKKCLGLHPSAKTADKSGYIGLFQKLMIASEKIFFLGADEYLERLEGKIRKHLFFYVQIF